MNSMDTRVILLGTGSVIPNPRRLSTSHLLLAGSQRILVDSGPGTGHRLAEAGYSPKDLTCVLITHLHADHCIELPAIALAAFLQGRDAPLPVYAPLGARAHYDMVFGQLFPYIPALLAARGKNFDVPVYDLQPGVVTGAPVKLSCTQVIHGSIPALGYRIDTERGSVGFSGDTAPSDDLVRLVTGVGLLVHECPYPDSNGPHPAHTIPSQLGPLAARSEARALALNHFFPMCDAARESMIESVARSYSGDIIFGEDLMTVTVPA